MFGRALVATMIATAIAGPTYAGSSVLWRNTTTGQNWLYQMENHSAVDSRPFSQVTDMDWKVAGYGDFNGDGSDDVLWRHAGFGINWVYLTDGTKVVDSLRINEVNDLNWSVAGVGDFNGDGNDDILWRHAISGDNWIYYMQGNAIVGSKFLNKIADPDWKVAGVGDLNSDGTDDIVLRNASTGLNWGYIIQNGSIVQSKQINQVSGAEWVIEGVDDFNGDLVADLLWRNTNTGDTYIYTMSGTKISKVGLVGRVPTQWQIESTGDRSMDSKSDILWRNSNTGVLWSYLMDGSTISDSAPVGLSVGNSWSLVATLQTQVATIQPIDLEIIQPGSTSAPSGQCIDLDATGFFSNGSQQTNPPGLNWQCNEIGIANVNAEGQVCGTADGTVSCTATWQGFDDSISLTFTSTPVEPSGFEITNGPFSLTVGDTAQVQSRGLFDNGSNTANPQSTTWSCASSSVSISSSGVITANAAVQTACTGSWEGFSDSVSVTVSQQPDTAIDIAIASSALSGEVGSSLTPGVTVTFSQAGDVLNPDGVTWTCNDITVVTVESQPTAGTPATLRLNNAGVANCTAKYEALTDIVAVTANEPASDFVVYMQKPAGWAGCKIHHWESPPAANTLWPGNDMEPLDDNWCVYTFPEGQTESKIVFNDGAGQQSGNLVADQPGCWTGGATWTPLSSCNIPADTPRVSANPGTSSFVGDAGLTVTLSISNGVGKYLIGNGDACAAGQTYTNNQQVTLGDGLNIGESVDLLLCGDDGALQVTDSYTYTRIEQGNLGQCEIPAYTGNPHGSEQAMKEKFQDLRIYQVMVESFIDGDPNRGYGTGYGSSHHNGDIRGIINSLPYIKSLGANAIWLTPIFNSDGGSQLDATGYFTRNYFEIDPKFGSWEDAKEMVDTAHSMGMYVFFDGVFGHHKGNIPTSPCGNNVTGGNDPVSYPGSLDFYKEVATFWIRELGIDGWRLDQAYQVPLDAWIEIRQAVESISKYNKQQGKQWGTLGYMVGEIWDGEGVIQSKGYGSASNPSLYSAFDFPIRYGLVQVLAGQEHIGDAGASGRPASWLNEKFVSIGGTYASHAIPNLMLSNHDLVRFGDLIERAGYPRDDWTYWGRHRAAFAFMAAFTGPITIYYGDEIGDEVPNFAQKVESNCWTVGLCDDHVSRTSGLIDGVSTSLNNEQRALKDYVAQLMDIRDTHRALSQGERTHLGSNEATYVDLKSYNGENVIFVLNVSTNDQPVSVDTADVGGTTVVDLVNGGTISANAGSFDFNIPGLSGQFFLVQ